MKNLIVMSAKLCKSFNSIKTINRTNLFGINSFFSTIKDQTVPKKRVSKNKNTASQQVTQNTSKKLHHKEQTPRQTIQKQALEFVTSYITIDELKNQPGSINRLLLTLIKVFEYDTTSRPREFYLQNQQAIEKIIYDLKSYNSESFMTPKQIILLFYLCKLASDCGHYNRVQGFEFRGTMKLASHIAVHPQQSRTMKDALTLDQAVYGYWLMSQNRHSNHEYKWKCHLMIMNTWSTWGRQYTKNFSFNQKGEKVFNKSISPITFSHLSALLSTYYTEEIHLCSEFKMFEQSIRILYIGRDMYICDSQMEKDENLFLETFTYLIGLDQYMFNGKTYNEIFEIVNLMTKIILKKLMSRLTNDESLVKSFVSSRNIPEFLKNTSFQSLSTSSPPDTLLNSPINNLSQEDIYRYFIFLDNVRENKLWFKNVAYQQSKKVQFVLLQIIETYFNLKFLKNDQKVSVQMLSIYTRFWIRKKEIELEELQDVIENSKQPNETKNEITQCSLEKIVKDFNFLSQILSKKLNEGIKDIEGTKKSKSNKKVYQTVQQKQIQKNKLTYLKNVELSVIKPLVDFIFANGKQTLMKTKLVSVQKRSMIDSFQNLLTQLFGQNNNDNLSEGKVLKIQSSYFWILKFMRLQSVNVIDNKLLLKEFQTLLLEVVLKNVASKNPHNYSVVPVYNLLAFMCRLQEIMMGNEENNLQESSDIKIQQFHKKKEYQYFMAYKDYLASLIFGKNAGKNDKSSTNQETKLQIPNKLRIDNLFVRSSQHSQTQKSTQSSTSFNIMTFFNIVFRENRFYNHKLLSQELLLHLFGTQEKMQENINEYIIKNNQRTGQNYYELIYMILLSGAKEINLTDIEHSIELEKVKHQIVQALAQKAKGSLVFSVLREVISPRKITYLKKTPLKYRQKPYSIFETISHESVQRKKQVANEFIKYFTPNQPQFFFGYVEMIFMNLEIWGKQKSAIVCGVLLPWALRRAKAEGFLKVTMATYITMFMRLLRFSIIRTQKQNQKYFLEMFQQHLPEMYANLQKNQKQHAYSILWSYAIQIESFIKYHKINDIESLYKILLQCRDNVHNTGNSQNIQKGQQSVYFLKFVDILEKILNNIKAEVDKKKTSGGNYRSGKLFSNESKRETTERIGQTMENRSGQNKIFGSKSNYNKDNNNQSKNSSEDTNNPKKRLFGSKKL